MPVDVLALGSSNVWMDAEISTDSRDYPLSSVLLHWNGSRWELVRSPVNGLAAMTPDGNGGIWFAARVIVSPGNLVDYQGGNWTVQPAPAPAVTRLSRQTSR
jgi:hypothetical protein